MFQINCLSLQQNKSISINKTIGDLSYAQDW